MPSDRLVKKLLRAGVSATVANFFASYLSERLAGVAVGGVFSEFTALANMVFQGTVLGPPLWNVFFADVAKAVNKNGSCESVFADDLNAFKAFDATFPMTASKLQ